MKYLDQKLVHKLKENARISTSELARVLDVSRTTVTGRIKKLEEEGVIRGYTVQYGQEYASTLLIAHVQIKVTQKLTEQTTRALRQIDQVRSLFAISGDYDLIAMIEAESTAKLNQVLDRIGDLEGIDRTNSSVILETKFDR
ncbi:MAG: DNA-binding Lrp family transcriptional regulator [Candidatus Azotimanducaceae bacterium]